MASACSINHTGVKSFQTYRNKAQFSGQLHARSIFSKFNGLKADSCLKSSFHYERLQSSRDAVKRLVTLMALSKVPQEPQGLYDPSFDKDACGVGFVAELSKVPTRKTV